MIFLHCHLEFAPLKLDFKKFLNHYLVRTEENLLCTHTHTYNFYFSTCIILSYMSFDIKIRKSTAPS